MASQIKETFTLPSKGLLYPKKTEEVTLRNMTAFEEKIIFGSNNFLKASKEVLELCAQDMKDLKINDLVVPDYHFLLYKLRIVTYGSKYHVSAECPNCGKLNKNIEEDLDDLVVNYLDDKFVEPINIDLPLGDSVGCRLLRLKDLEQIDRKGREIRKQFPDYQGDPEYLLRMEAYITTVNGDEIADLMKKDFVANMSGKDSAAFKNKIDEIKFGYDLKRIGQCKYCDEDMEYSVPINEEFFRPR